MFAGEVLRNISRKLAFLTLRFQDRGEPHEETSYRSRSGDCRGRGSCHAHHGGCALAGLGPGAWRPRRRGDRRQRICAALLCVSVLQLRVWALLRLRVSGVLQLWLSAVLRLRGPELLRLLRRTLLTNGCRRRSRSTGGKTRALLFCAPSFCALLGPHESGSSVLGLITRPTFAGCSADRAPLRILST